MSTTVRFTIPGEPKGKQRPRFTRSGRTYTPQQTATYENLVKLTYMQSFEGVRLHGAIQAQIIGVFPVPASVSKKQRLRLLSGSEPYTRKIDADNLAKIILDALNGIAYDDDKQVAVLQVSKKYGRTPCVTVTLSEIEVIPDDDK